MRQHNSGYNSPCGSTELPRETATCYISPRHTWVIPGPPRAPGSPGSHTVNPLCSQPSEPSSGTRWEVLGHQYTHCVPSHNPVDEVGHGRERSSQVLCMKAASTREPRAPRSIHGLTSLRASLTPATAALGQSRK